MLTRRSPMKPGAPLQRRTPLRSTTRLRQTAGLLPSPFKKKSKKKPRKAERDYLGHVAALGCAVCRRLGYGPTPAEVHHPRKGTGMAQRAPHRDAIPLCPAHHRGNEGIHGLGVKRFSEEYGFDEAELTRETQALLAPHVPEEVVA
ncbi:Ref family recombination enhancement nuclease [Cupriavidus sp. USMAA2-4]|uniref:Ref family recombination enhancement nuclease n=1 Tax=Cupriavidus sp. USMAA2-4 TaxID=876364 RepID=UPI001E57398C|nr:Ref family recombination enhancement nuclease [Cupriavidus sp. USMAA2-4]